MTDTEIDIEHKRNRPRDKTNQIESTFERRTIRFIRFGDRAVLYYTIPLALLFLRWNPSPDSAMPSLITTTESAIAAGTVLVLVLLSTTAERRSIKMPSVIGTSSGSGTSRLHQEMVAVAAALASGTITTERSILDDKTATNISREDLNYWRCSNNSNSKMMIIMV